MVFLKSATTQTPTKEQAMEKTQTPVGKPGVNSVTITMHDRNSPTYVFTGEWAGRDIKVVQRTLVREYNLKVRATRRGLTALSELKEVLPAKG